MPETDLCLWFSVTKSWNDQLVQNILCVSIKFLQCNFFVLLMIKFSVFLKTMKGLFFLTDSEVLVHDQLDPFFWRGWDEVVLQWLKYKGVVVCLLHISHEAKCPSRSCLQRSPTKLHHPSAPRWRLSLYHLSLLHGFCDEEGMTGQWARTAYVEGVIQATCLMVICVSWESRVAFEGCRGETTNSHFWRVQTSWGNTVEYCSSAYISWIFEPTKLEHTHLAQLCDFSPAPCSSWVQEVLEVASWV
jgi:hypothetical protein